VGGLAVNSGAEPRNRSKKFDLQIEFAYRLSTGYKKLLRPRQWVGGFPVELRIRVTNRSSETFPGTGMNLSIYEYGQSVGQQGLGWGAKKPEMIPKIEPEESSIIKLGTFIPMIEGLCEIKVNLDEPTNSEVWITGWRQATPRRKEISVRYITIRSQELEIIKLLTKLTGGK